MKHARIGIVVDNISDDKAEDVLDKLIKELNFPIRREDDVSYYDTSIAIDTITIAVRGASQKKFIAEEIYKDIKSCQDGGDKFDVSITIDFIDEETFTF
jgi:hypothetical protein